jgi:Ubiquitin-2 like Rad60 SUMO-like
MLGDGSQVVSAQGEEVFFKIKRNTKLSKLQGAYANKVGKDVGSIRCDFVVFYYLFPLFPGYAGVAPFVRSTIFVRVLCCMLTLGPLVNRFLYDGIRINDDDTPASLDMDDGGACP